MVNFIMLNPSTANETQDDQTTLRCISFARDWGYGQLKITNLFAFRTPQPSELFAATTDPVGTENDGYILRTAGAAHLVVAAWGNDGHHLYRSTSVLEMLKEYKIHPAALQLTSQKAPAHPSRLKKFLVPIDLDTGRPIANIPSIHQANYHKQMDLFLDKWI